jgi:hypothetical protein
MTGRKNLFERHRSLGRDRLDSNLDAIRSKLLECRQILIINREHIHELAFSRYIVHAADIDHPAVQS